MWLRFRNSVRKCAEKAVSLTGRRYGPPEDTFLGDTQVDAHRGATPNRRWIGKTRWPSRKNPSVNLALAQGRSPSLSTSCQDVCPRSSWKLIARNAVERVAIRRRASHQKEASLQTARVCFRPQDRRCILNHRSEGNSAHPMGARFLILTKLSFSVQSPVALLRRKGAPVFRWSPS